MGSFLRSDWEASTTVTIELPSPDQLSARPYIYVCAPHAPTGPRVPGVLPPKVSVLCQSNAERIRPSLPRVAPFFVADEVLASQNPANVANSPRMGHGNIHPAESFLQQSNSFNPPHSESAITVVRFQLASKTISSSDQTWSANPAAIAGASCGFWRNCSA